MVELYGFPFVLFFCCLAKLNHFQAKKLRSQDLADSVVIVIAPIASTDNRSSPCLTPEDDVLLPPYLIGYFFTMQLILSRLNETFIFLITGYSVSNYINNFSWTWVY